jgi:ABC-type antimicrobial peptide transport system permease subunit
MAVLERTPDVPPGPQSAGLGSGRGRIWRSLLHNPLGLTGGIMLVIVAVVGLLAPVLAPYGPAEVHFDAPFQAPSATFSAPTTWGATSCPA